MQRKILCVLLAIMLLVSGVVWAKGPTEITMADKLAVIERVLYGTEQNGAMAERASRLERDFYGHETNDILQAKVDRMYHRVKDVVVSGTSFTTELNAVERMLTGAVTIQPVSDRVANMEKLLWGSSSVGAMEIRLNRLLKAAYAGGRVEMTPVKLEKDTLVKIKINLTIDSKTSRVGDAIGFEVAEDVFNGDALAIAKGARGTGRVTKAQPAKNFGRDAKLEVAFESVEGIDGTSVPVLLGEKAKAQTMSMAKAAGASVTGMLLLGPVGLLGGAFVKGQDVAMQAGTELYVQVAAETSLSGVKVR